jgi:hypothetical protein
MLVLKEYTRSFFYYVNSSCKQIFLKIIINLPKNFKQRDF